MDVLEHEHLERLKQRRAYLAERIKAKQIVGWETLYDQSEHDALAWILQRIMVPERQEA